MNGVFASLLKKEWLDAIRDKRAFTSAMLGALLGPVIFGVMMLVQMKQAEKLEPINIAVEGQAQFPSLLQAFEREGIFVDNKKAKDSKITVTVAEDFAEHIAKGKTAEITIKGDFSERESQRRLDRIKRVVQQFSGELAGMRLMARGIAPKVVRPVKIVELDTSSAQARAGFFLSLLATMALMSVFVSSTNVAIDCSAGERERNSLEFLLAQPVNTLTLVLAKMLNTSFFSLFGTAMSLAVMSLVLALLPLNKLGLDFSLTVPMVLVIWLAMVPLAMFAASLQLVTSFVSKTFKEAQSYISMTIIFPVMLPMMLVMSNVDFPVFKWLPLTGQIEFVADLLKGNELHIAALMVCSGGAVAFTALFVAIMTRGLKTEKMILGL